MTTSTIHLVHDDLPANVTFPNGMVAIDTETTGLEVKKVKLCLCQVGDGNGNVWLVKFKNDYSAPNLKAVLSNPTLTKLMHFARFDAAILQHNLGINIPNIFCTKIAHRLLNPAATKHNLRTLVETYCGVLLDKGEQMSNWAAPELTDSQKTYAASDVLYLHAIYTKMQDDIAAKGARPLLDAALAFLPARVVMDLTDHPEGDLFAHH